MLDGGTAKCWGSLGDNTAYADVTTPQAVATDLKFTQLSAHGRIACGVTADGAAYCWGPNTMGQLGNGSTDAGSKTPVQVKTTQHFAMIAGGDPLSCAVTTDGDAHCWGANANNQPVVEPTLVGGGIKFNSVSVSAQFACGIGTDGAAYCWGANADGQLGSGKPISNQTTDISEVPVKVVGGLTWNTVSAGQHHACGIATDGKTYCWGANEYRFGNGTESSSKPVAVSGNAAFAQLDVGRDFACGLTSNGAAHCWGANGLGELGNGDADPQDLSRTPLAVVGGRTFTSISASDGEHVCAITSDAAAVYCWGRNDHGQLGNGAVSGSNTARTASPVQAKL